MNLTGRTIIITGGGTGIGAATALACARAGMRVVVAGRRPDPLAGVVARIEAAGARAIGVPLNVNEPGHADVLLDAAMEAFDSVHAVFANAGYGVARQVHEQPAQELRAMFDTNFFATQTLLAKSARWMLDRGQGGHLLACSSCVSKFAAPWYGGYAATKAAQDLLCQAMRPELAPHGIAVSTVHPIGTETEFSAVVEQMSDRRKEGRPPTTPKWLTQKAHQVGEAVVRCLRRPRPEVWTSLPTRFVGAARQLWPRMLDRKFAAMVRAQQP